MKLGIGYKVVAIFLGLQFFLLVILSSLYARKGVQVLEQELAQRGKSMVRYMADLCEYGVLSKNPNLLEDVASRVMRQEAVVGVRIEDSESEVVVQKGQCDPGNDVAEFVAPVLVQKPTEEEEALFALEDGVGLEEIGKVHLCLSKTDAKAKIVRLRNYVLTLAIISLMVTGAIGITLINYFISDPLSKLRSGVGSISRGNLDLEVKLRSRDELADLAEAFNQMVKSLKHQIERRINVERDMAQKRNLALLGELSAMLLHEVGNTINRFRFIRYRLSQENLSPEGQEVIEVFEKELKSLERFTTNLSLFSQKPELKLKQVDLETLIQGLAASMRLMDKKGVNIQVDLPEHPCKIIADRELIHHTLLNILKNAMDAVSEGGRVGINLLCEKGLVKIRITDNGPGIPQENLDQVFKPFFSTKGPLGTGLGLAIAKSFIQAHGGDITIESRPGKTTFTVTIPIDYPSELPA